MEKRFKFTQLTISVACILSFGNFTILQDKLIERAHWMAGTWESKTSRGSIYESWRIVSTHKLTGKSYSLNGKDTVLFETTSLTQEQNTLFYSPTVTDQNNQQPIRFKLISSSDHELTFENKKHDFPQVITYRMINADSLVAEISGMKEGKYRASRFAMSRLKSEP